MNISSLGKQIIVEGFPSSMTIEENQNATKFGHVTLVERYLCNKDEKHDIKPSNTMEWCLETTFFTFINLAESKVQLLLQQSAERELDLNRYLQNGIDHELDSCMESLSSFAKHAVSDCITSLFEWRETSLESNPEKLQPLPPFNPATNRGSIRAMIRSLEQMQDVRLIILNILFCRVLIRIIQKLEPSLLKDDVCSKCEELSLYQLHLSFQENIRPTANWLTNATYFARVLGEISRMRFNSITDRYVRELEKNSSSGSLKEGKCEYLIFGIKFIKIKLFPMESVEDVAEFLLTLSHFFLNSSDGSVRLSIADVLVDLLLPLCEVVSAEVNFPVWIDFVESIYPKVQKMAMKPRYQSTCLTLLTCLLCISTSSFFSKNWMSFLDICQSKFKDRNMRNDSLLRFTQILWVYLFRYPESTTATQARINQLVKLLFPVGRRFISPPDCNLDLFIYIVYMIGVRFNVWTITHVIGYLLNCEAAIDSWSPERMTIAIESLSFLYDAWSDGVQRPLFPSNFLPRKKSKASTLNEKQLSMLKPLYDTLQKVFDGLHHFVGSYLLDDEKSRTILPFRTSFSAGNITNEASTPDKEQHQASLIASIPNNRIPFLELLKILVQFIPKLPAAFEMDKIIDTFCMYSLHIDKKLCDTSIQALTTLAEQNTSFFSTILIALEKRVMAINDRQFDLLGSFYVKQENSVEHQHSGVLEIYVDFFLKGKAYTNNLPIDALCLYLLCSPYAHLRKIVLQILSNSSSLVNKILSHFGLSACAGASSKRSIEEWNVHFSQFMSYCVDFLSRDSIKKAIYFSLERANYLSAVMAPADTGILWTTIPRSPSEETLCHWKRCSILVILGIHYLPNPREVISGYLGLLSSDFSNVREAVHFVLSHTAPSHQSLLLDELIPLVQLLTEDLKQRAGKRFYAPKKMTKLDRLRVELPKLLSIIKHFSSLSLPHFISLLKSFRNFLSDQKSNTDLDTVRSAFCIFVHHFFLCNLEEPLMDLRSSLFNLLYEWDEIEATRAMTSLIRTKILPPSTSNALSRPPSAANSNFDGCLALEQILNWISDLFQTPEALSIAREALKCMLWYNEDSPKLFETIIQQCYSMPPNELKYQPYFLALTDVFLAKEVNPWTATRLEALLILSLTKFSDLDNEIRRSAFDMLLRLQDRAFLNLDLSSTQAIWHYPMHSKLRHVHILERLNKWHPDWIYPCLSEIFLRLSMCHVSLQHTLFTFLPFLVKNIKLGPDIYSIESRFILDNLLYFTIVHGENHSLEIRKTWLSLVSDSMDNLKLIIDYFVAQARNTSNALGVTYFQSILSFFKNMDAVFTNLLSFLSPTSFILKNLQISQSSIQGPSEFFIADLTKILPPVSEQWTEGVVGALLVVGIIHYLSPFLIEQSFSLFLVASVVLLDHPDTFITKEMQRLLKLILKREDLNFQSLDELVPFVVCLLSKDILDAWNAMSLCWGSTCTILHVAIQCLKMFRYTLRIPNLRQLTELLNLFKEASSNPNQSFFAMECLISIHAILKHAQFDYNSKSLTPCLQIMLNQLLNREPTHLEYVLNILGRLLDLVSPEQLVKTIGDSEDMGSLTLILLRCFQNTGFDPCRILLNRLLNIDDSPFLTQKPILILLANLPFLVQLPLQDWVDAFCVQLSQTLTSFDDVTNLKRSLLAWRKCRAKTNEEFIQHLCNLLKPILFQQPHFYLPVIFQFLASPNRAYMATYLLFLKCILPYLILETSYLVHVSMVHLLVELAQNNDALGPMALEVLDCIFRTMPYMTRTGIMLPPRLFAKPFNSPLTGDEDLSPCVSCTFLTESADLILEIPKFENRGSPIRSTVNRVSISSSSSSTSCSSSSPSDHFSSSDDSISTASTDSSLSENDLTLSPTTAKEVKPVTLMDAWIHSEVPISSLPPLPPSPPLPSEEIDVIQLEEITFEAQD